MRHLRCATFCALCAGSLCTFALLFVPSQASAETDFTDGDELSADTTWDEEHGPYLISGAFAVDPGVTLTIEPGTSVLLAPNARVIIQGSLEAHGSVDAPVNFALSQTVSNLSNGWMLYFAPNAQGDISHTDISGLGAAGLWVDHAALQFVDSTLHDSDRSIGIDYSTLSLARSTFSHLGGEVISLYDGSSATISDLAASDVSSGVLLFSASSATLTDSQLSNLEQDGIGVYEGSSISIESTIIMDGQGDGVGVYSTGSNVHVTDTTVSGFSQLGRSGLAAYGAAITAQGVTLQDNWFGLSVYESSVTISQSAIAGNSFGGIYTPDSTVSAENNWWGDPSGPSDPVHNPGGTGDNIDGDITYDPWLSYDPTLKKGASNVLFLPGIQASRLYLKQGLLGVENQLWEPNRNADALKLAMDENGQSINSGIYTRDIIGTSNLSPFGLLDEDVYQSFENYLDNLVSSNVIVEWKAFPYDWRLSVEDVVSQGALLEDGTHASIVAAVEALAETSKSGKVTIVAHSNGGLVGEELIDELKREGKENLIDKIIMVDVPQLGTPEAIAGLLHGYGEGLCQIGEHYLCMNPATARQIGQNMTGAYGLLPYAGYFSHVNGPVIEFDSDASSTIALRSRYGDSISSMDALQAFLTGADDLYHAQPLVDQLNDPVILNSDILAHETAVHAHLDDWEPPTDIEAIQIAGWGRDTTYAVKYTDHEEKNCTLLVFSCSRSFQLDMQPLTTINGDGTVTLLSQAAHLNWKTYYINLKNFNLQNNANRKHADVLEINSVETLIGQLLSSSSEALPSYISTNVPDDNDQGSLEVSAHSPVLLDIYDSNGNHTGPINNPDPDSDLVLYESSIPNSSYMPFGEGIYVGLPTNQIYTVRLHGTGSGFVTLDMDSVDEDGTHTTLVRFSDVPVSTSTIAEILYEASSTEPQLKLDEGGDGVFEQVILPGIYEQGGESTPSTKSTTVASHGGSSESSDLNTETITLLAALTAFLNQFADMQSLSQNDRVAISQLLAQVVVVLHQELAL